MTLRFNTDVDIDFFDRERVLMNLPHVRAKLQGKDQVHNSGIYFQKIPKDPMTNIATIGYDDAADMGFFKVDFLNNAAYEGVKNEEHLYKLIEQEPVWEMLTIPEIIAQLFHISSYSALTVAMAPTSVLELAMLLAVIRPAKSGLRYKSWDVVEKEVWIKTVGEGYFFKKSHAVSYAMVIVIQMNLLSEKASKTTNMLHDPSKP